MPAAIEMFAVLVDVAVSGFVVDSLGMDTGLYCGE
jgi:hypothetical protein